MPLARMTPAPCVVCAGKCCRDDLGYRVIHMGAEFYEHVCDDCRDGEKYVPPRTAVSPLALCTDPRCVNTQRCWRAENEDFGNAPGENYGPRCTPAPALDLAAERLAALLDAERENTALRELLDAKSHEAGLYARRMEQAQRSRDAAVREERAAVVAWLRERHTDTQELDGRSNAVSRTYDRAATIIERGEHRREEER